MSVGASLPVSGDSGELPSPTRVAAVLTEPAAERAPLLSRVGAVPEIELSVVSARRGRARRLVDRAYASTMGIRRSLASLAPDVVVAEGWRSLASQTAIAWSRIAHVPYLLLVDEWKPHEGRLGAVADAAVSPIVHGAAGVLVESAEARRDVLERGVSPERVRVVPRAVDVEDLGARAERLRPKRDELRDALGARRGDVVVLSAGPLDADRRHEDLVHAVAETGNPRLVVVLAGTGPERERLAELAEVRAVRLVVVGERESQRGPSVELYAAADVFALPSERDAWAIVTEAAACGLPLVLAGAAGASHDLLEDGRNGILVQPGRVEQASAALRWLAVDEELRHALGIRSRELARDWGYRPSVDGLVAAVREAVSDTTRRAGAR
jgi:glycosyltransferase involved in cell wall biosynthesis